MFGPTCSKSSLSSSFSTLITSVKSNEVMLRLEFESILKFADTHAVTVPYKQFSIERVSSFQVTIIIYDRKMSFLEIVERVRVEIS